MFRKAILSVLAVMSLVVVSSGTASAYYRGGWHGPRYGYRVPVGPLYRRPYVAPVYVPPVAYGYPGYTGFGYGYGGAYAPGYGYGAPGVGVSTPGFGFYVR